MHQYNPFAMQNNKILISIKLEVDVCSLSDLELPFTQTSFFYEVVFFPRAANTFVFDFASFNIITLNIVKCLPPVPLC